jgi:hypothetical protein
VVEIVRSTTTQSPRNDLSRRADNLARRARQGQHAASWVRWSPAEGDSQSGLSFFDLGDDGRIARITDFWPEPYEPPADRAHLVERY